MTATRIRDRLSWIRVHVRRHRPWPAPGGQGEAESGDATLRPLRPGLRFGLRRPRHRDRGSPAHRAGLRPVRHPLDGGHRRHSHRPRVGQPPGRPIGRRGTRAPLADSRPRRSHRGSSGGGCGRAVGGAHRLRLHPGGGGQRPRPLRPAGPLSGSRRPVPGPGRYREPGDGGPPGGRHQRGGDGGFDPGLLHNRLPPPPGHVRPPSPGSDGRGPLRHGGGRQSSPGRARDAQGDGPGGAGTSRPGRSRFGTPSTRKRRSTRRWR